MNWSFDDPGWQRYPKLLCVHGVNVGRSDTELVPKDHEALQLGCLKPLISRKQLCLFPCDQIFHILLAPMILDVCCNVQGGLQA